MKLRKIEFRDLQTRVDWMNNPKVYSSMHYEVPVLLEKTILWYDNIQGNASRIDVVFETQGGIVAMGGLTGIDSLKKAELYIFVNPNQQTKGIGTHATKLLCRYGFDVLGLSKIFLVTNQSNIVAQRLYEKVGFRLVLCNT